MKKSIMAVASTLMAGAMVLGIAGCKNPDTPNNPNNPNEPENPVPPVNTEMSLYERADYLARAVDEHYATRDNGNLYVAGYYNALEGETDGYANCYEYSSLLTMANYMYSVSTDEAKKTYYKGLLDDYVKGLDNFTGDASYISSHGTMEWKDIYCVHRQETPGTGDPSTDMVYDDLMWIIRDFMKIYKTTGEEKYIPLAENLTNCCLDGWDSTKGGIGGIVWGPIYESKHACSNGPIISALCDLAEYYKDKDDVVTAKDTVYGEKPAQMDKVEWENMIGMKKYDYYLNWAKTVYDFTYTSLRNSDNTFVDLIRGAKATPVVCEQAEGGRYHYFDANNKGRTEGKTFTYNTGSVLSGAAGLYRLTGDETYLTQGRLMAEGAYHRFTVTANVGGQDRQMYVCTDSLLFNEVLMQGYIDLADACKAQNASAYESVKAETAQYINVFKSSINYAFDTHLINRTLPQNYLNGWLYASTSGAETMDTHKDIKNATATPAIMALIVQYEKTHGEIK